MAISKRIEQEKEKNVEMWFFVAIIGMVVAYVSGRKWGQRLYNYYRPRIAYIVPYFRRKYRPLTPALLPTAVADDDINAKKKFDLESVIIQTIKIISTTKMMKIR